MKQGFVESFESKKKEMTPESLRIIKETVENFPEFVEREFSKGVNTWTQCVRTQLGQIMSESQFLSDELVDPDYVHDVEVKGEYVLGKLREIELSEKPHTDIEAETYPMDPINDKPTAPPRGVQEEIFELISGLKWQKSDLVETQ